MSETGSPPVSTQASAATVSLNGFRSRALRVIRGFHRGVSDRRHRTDLRFAPRRRTRKTARTLDPFTAATAFVSGTAAALKAASGKSPAEVEQLLREVLAPKPVPKP